jgi:hypothetical protein
MSHYSAHAYDPETDTIRMAAWMDDYFGHYQYGVQFYPEGPVFRPHEVSIPHEEEQIWVRKERSDVE